MARRNKKGEIWSRNGLFNYITQHILTTVISAVGRFLFLKKEPRQPINQRNTYKYKELMTESRDEKKEVILFCDEEKSRWRKWFLFFNDALDTLYLRVVWRRLYG